MFVSCFFSFPRRRIFFNSLTVCTRRVSNVNSHCYQFQRDERKGGGGGGGGGGSGGGGGRDGSSGGGGGLYSRRSLTGNQKLAKQPIPGIVSSISPREELNYPIRRDG